MAFSKKYNSSIKIRITRYNIRFLGKELTDQGWKRRDKLTIDGVQAYEIYRPQIDGGPRYIMIVSAPEGSVTYDIYGTIDSDTMDHFFETFEIRNSKQVVADKSNLFSIQIPNDWKVTENK